MDWLKKNPEKLALVLVSLVALGFGIKHLLAVQTYAGRFELAPPSKKGQEIPEPPESVVERSAALVELPLFWTDKSLPISGSSKTKEVPLLRSVYIVEKDGKLYDLADPNEAQLRPPVPNEWILGHGLDILNPKILEADPDSDGYTNLEEWEAKTDPLQRDSHPPYTDKLFFVSRPQVNLTLVFAANNAPDFQITLVTDRGSLNRMYKEGESFPDSKKFTLLKYLEPEDGDAAGAKLEVRDNETQRTMVLPLKTRVPAPVLYVEFEFVLGRTPEEQKFRVKEGDSFRLGLEPDTEYVLEEAGAESATIKRAGSDEGIVIGKR